MSHFAELDKNNIVLRVLVGNNDLPNEGLDWFVQNAGGRWIQTSYSASFRHKFANIGDTYNEELDAFITASPFTSWVLNDNTCEWEAPFPKPDNGLMYQWDESVLNWVKVQGE